MINWLLDSGASYHMTRNVNLLNSSCDISLITIVLSNGALAFARKHDSAKLNDKLILSIVLYVPGLHYDLIYIAQLIDDLCCTVAFTRKLCVIQGPTTQALIGSVEHRRGIHFYQDGSTTKVQAK